MSLAGGEVGLPKSENLVTEETISLPELIRNYLQVKQENEALKIELANLRKQNEGLVQSFQMQLGAVVADNVTLRADNLNLHTDNLNLHAEITTLRAANEAFRTEIANLKADYATLDSKLQELLRNISKLTWREGMRTLENYLVLRVLGSKNKMKSMQIYTANTLMDVAKADASLQSRLGQELGRLRLNSDDLNTLIFIKETGNTFIHDVSFPSAAEDLATVNLPPEDQEAGARLVLALEICCREAGLLGNFNKLFFA